MPEIWHLNTFILVTTNEFISRITETSLYPAVGVTESVTSYEMVGNARSFNLKAHHSHVRTINS